MARSETLSRCAHFWSDRILDSRVTALDLLRLLALSSLPAELLPSILASISSAGTSPSKAAEVNGMLAVRAVANGLAGTRQVKDLLAGQAGEVVSAVGRGLSGVGKNGRVAAATVGLKCVSPRRD